MTRNLGKAVFCAASRGLKTGEIIAELKATGGTPLATELSGMGPETAHETVRSFLALLHSRAKSSAALHAAILGLPKETVEAFVEVYAPALDPASEQPGLPAAPSPPAKPAVITEPAAAAPPAPPTPGPGQAGQSEAATTNPQATGTTGSAETSASTPDKQGESEEAKAATSAGAPPNNQGTGISSHRRWPEDEPASLTKQLVFVGAAAVLVLLVVFSLRSYNQSTLAEPVEVAKVTETATRPEKTSPLPAITVSPESAQPPTPVQREEQDVAVQGESAQPVRRTALGGGQAADRLQIKESEPKVTAPPVKPAQPPAPPSAATEPASPAKVEPAKPASSVAESKPTAEPQPAPVANAEQVEAAKADALLYDRRYQALWGPVPEPWHLWYERAVRGVNPNFQIVYKDLEVHLTKREWYFRAMGYDGPIPPYNEETLAAIRLMLRYKPQAFLSPEERSGLCRDKPLRITDGRRTGTIRCVADMITAGIVPWVIR